MISTLNAFHGRTLMTVTAGGQAKYSSGFGPNPVGFTHIPYNDVAALEAAFRDEGGDDICAVILEPMQGEGGMTPGTPEFLQAARRLCSEHGALLILDEIQSGMGRTGTLFSYMQKGIVPDILTSAKGLGGGFPIGAMLTTAEVASAFSVGVHGTTYGGNPLACAVAVAVFDVINTTEVLDGVKARHALFMEGLKAINARRHVFRDLRGEGVWLGAELDAPWKGKAMDVVKAAGRCRAPGARRGAGRGAPRTVARDQPRRDPRRARAARSRAQPRADLTLATAMFFVRPIARDDLPAVLALSERTGHGLTTLPANQDRLASRIDRSLASFARTASRADECYVFVLIDSDERPCRRHRRRSRPQSGWPSPGTTIASARSSMRRARCRSTPSRRRCSSPTITRGTPSSARCSSTRLSAVRRTGRWYPRAGSCSLPSLPTASPPKSLPNCADASMPKGGARSGKAWAGISSRWSTRPPTT